MDEDMSFPNPVERHDLPVKKNHWKRYAIGALVVGLLGIVLMPQIIHNRVGRRLLRARLESKYNADISIGDITTSWRGGTTVSQFWIKGTDGRIIGFNSLKSDLSLWKMLRGRYDLGKCEIDGLVVDYVFDSGDDAHRDTYERLTGALPWKAGMPAAELAHLSGDITLTNAQLNLYRGETDPRTLNAVFQSVRFTALDGSMQIASLDQPWKFQLDGAVGLTGEERNQTFECAGTVSLGEGGRFVPSAVQVDATAKGTNVPTELIGVMFPLLTPADYRPAFGAKFERLNLALTGSGGVLTLDIRELAGPGTQVHVKPTFDLKPNPAIVTMASKSDGDNTITVALPKGPARRGLACVNPLIQQAIEGTMVLRIKSMNMPLARQWWVGNASAQIELQDVKLAGGRDASGEGGMPRGLLGQLSVVSGDTNPTPLLTGEPANFIVDSGAINIAPAAMKVGSAEVTLSGTSTVEGDLKMTMAVNSAKLQADVPEMARTGKPLVIPLTGTPEKPRLLIAAAMASLPAGLAEKVKAWTDAQLSALRAREAEAAQHEKERQVQEMLRTLNPTGAGNK